MRKTWEESHFLVTLHWTYHATKNEFASEGRAYPLLSLQTYRARLGMTERERERLITLDDNDPQSLEVTRQVETGLFLIGIDHSVYDDYVRNFLLDDLVIDFDGKLDVNNVIRGSDKP